MKIIFTTALIIIFVFFDFSVGQQASGFRVQVLNTTASSTTLEYIVDGYSQKEIDISGSKYLLYEIPGMIWLMDKGYPQLPSVNNSIIIPDMAGMNFRILDEEYQLISTGPVMPSKGHFTRDINPNTVPFIFSDIYQDNTWYPGNNIALNSPYIVRDLRGQTVQFNPMQYNPVLGQIKICTRIVVEIFADNSVTAVNPFIRAGQLRGVSKDFDEIYETLFLNYGKEYYDYIPIPEPGRLLIIYPTAFAANIVPFYNWKVAKGIPTLLAEYPTQTGTGSDAIKSYIQNLYNSPDGLTYIILVGESNQIPTLYGLFEGAPSDPCYVKLAGSDAYPDAYISRISPSSPANLDYVLWKLIKYEKYPDTGVNGTWYLKGTGVASNEGSPPDWHYTDTLRAMLMNNMYFTQVDRIYDPGAASSTVSAALNEGRSILNYIGHGSGTSWGTTGFSNSAIHALTNGYKNPFIFDVACLNGNFTATECMEEAWIRAGDSINAKGAIAAYGSSTNASWVPPLDMQYHSMYLLTTRQRQTVGGVCFNGLMKGMDLWGGSSGEGLKMMEQYNIFGDCTTMLTFGMIPDSTAPEQITDLAAADPTSNSVKVGWTSPFDSSLGGVVSYDLRHSTTPITSELEFNAAASVIIPGGPDSAGVVKSFTLNNLNFNTLYYFAVKSKDIWGNTSVMSNVTSLISLHAPLISVTPDSLYSLIQPDTTGCDTIFISNTSPESSTLDYSVELANNVFPNKLRVSAVPLSETAAYNEVKLYTKENPDDSPGLSMLGSGGPDLFGYEWIDSNDPNGPLYVWNDIATTGTLVTNWVATSTYPAVDEGKAGPFQLGFNFNFYGLPYPQIWISANGWLSFTDFTDAAMTNGTIPSASSPNGIIAPLWDDLDGKTTGKVYYKQEYNRFIIQFDNWPGYSSLTGPFTFQVILYKNGKILIYYKIISGNSNSCTVGIENHNGNDGLQVVRNGAYLNNNLALQFSAEPDWLQPDILSGRIYNNNSVALKLTYDTEGLAVGNYSMDFIIHSNDPLNPEITVPVSLLVTNEVPVEMLEIKARNNNNEVIIEWSTRTETNNKGFLVERIENNKWQIISFAAGKGTTTEPADYLFSEKVNKAGNYKYRISQVDFNGEINFSQELEVTVTGPDRFNLGQNYPNPFNPSTTINYAVPEQSIIKISVFNVLGEETEVLLNNVVESGYYTLNWIAYDLPSGIYILRLEARSVSGNREYRSTRKMNLVK